MGTFICHLSHDYLCKGITMTMKLSMHNNWISRTPISKNYLCYSISTIIKDGYNLYETLFHAVFPHE